MSETIAVGDVVTVRFDGTTLPTCAATVTAINGPIAHIRYEDGVFHGLRGMIRLSGWTRGEPRARRTA